MRRWKSSLNHIEAVLFVFLLQQLLVPRLAPTQRLKSVHDRGTWDEQLPKWFGRGQSCSRQGNPGAKGENMVTVSQNSEASTKVPQFRYVRYVGCLCKCLMAHIERACAQLRPSSGKLRQRILFFPKQIMLLKHESLWQTGIILCQP